VRALGAGAAAQHTCAVLKDGSVHCWGSDSDGQLGSGATTEEFGRFSPNPVAVRW
jgi:alpha-tubulin suppressor-like RCC1 family protein